MVDGTPTPALTVDASKAQLVEQFNALASQVRSHGKEGLNKDAVEAEFASIRASQRALDERLATAASRAVTGTHNELKQFVVGDLAVLQTSQRALDGSVHRVVGDEGIKRGFTEVPGLLDANVQVCGSWHQELRDLVNARTLARLVLPADDSRGQRPSTPMLDDSVRRHIERCPEPDLKTRLLSGASGSGSDWQQTDVLPTIMTNLVTPAQPVEDLFEVVPMRRKSVVMPFATAMPFAYAYGIPAGNNPNNFTASDIPTSNRTLTSVGNAVAIQIFEDAEEDAIADLAPLFNALITEGARQNKVMAIINGDTNGQDTLTGWNPRSMFDPNATFGGSDDPRKQVIGLRAYAYDASSTRDASGDTTFSATLKAGRAALKAPHGVSGDLVYLTSQEHYLNSIIFDANVVTMDKYGPNATVLRGEVGAYAGTKIVVSDHVTADLAATGLYTGSGSYTSGILFNRKMFVLGERKAYTLETYREVRNGVRYLILVFRWAFKSRAPGSTDKVAHVSYKL